MLEDLLFALELGLKVVSAFIIGLGVGLWLDCYFETKPILLLVMLMLVFIYVMKLLLGVGKHE